jgi:hypothetical protein
VKAKRDDGTEFRGHLTTDHSSSSFNQPVFVFDDGSDFDDSQGYAWGDLAMNQFTELLPEDDAEAKALPGFLSVGRPRGQ